MARYGAQHARLSHPGGCQFDLKLVTTMAYSSCRPGRQPCVSDEQIRVFDGIAVKSLSAG